MVVFDDEEYTGLKWAKKITSDTVFECCSFVGCDFSDAVFNSVKFIECKFTGCNLSMAKLSECELKGILFNGCKMLGINFSECSDLMFSVEFSNCILDYCSFERKKIIKTPFSDCSLRNADFSECDLTGSSFKNCDLLYTAFNRTNLKQVDFVSARSYIINPEANNIRKAKFSAEGLPGLLAKYDIEIE